MSAPANSWPRGCGTTPARSRPTRGRSRWSPERCESAPARCQTAPSSRRTPAPARRPLANPPRADAAAAHSHVRAGYTPAPVRGADRRESAPTDRVYKLPGQIHSVAARRESGTASRSDQNPCPTYGNRFAVFVTPPGTGYHPPVTLDGNAAYQRHQPASRSEEHTSELQSPMYLV